MEKVQVIAKFYTAGSMFCPASTPSYKHVVAIPLEHVPAEFKKHLWRNAPDYEEYFVFEYIPVGTRGIANSFTLPLPNPVAWKLCWLVLRDQVGLVFSDDTFN